MGALDPLKDLYFKIEDKYYAFCDYLENSLNLPVYDAFVTPVESRGLPSFPLALLVFALLVGGIALAALTLFPGTTTLTVYVDAADKPVANIPVTLLIDGNDFASVQTDAGGLATFKNVPVGKTAKLQVAGADFEPFVKTFLVGKQEQRITASLQSPVQPLQPQVVTLHVTDDNGIPLGAVTVSYRDSLSASGDYKTAATDANGVARLKALGADSQLDLKLSKAGFQDGAATFAVSASQTLTVRMTPASQLPPDQGGLQRAKGTVVVTVADDRGNPVPAKVSLYVQDSDAALDEQRAGDSGKAKFSGVDAVGSLVYVEVAPTDDTFLPYDGSSDSKKLKKDETLEFAVTLVRKAPTQSYDVTLTAQDADDHSALSGVLVRLYNPVAGTNAKLAEKETDASGSVTFTSSKTVYATLYKDGYLAQRLVDLNPGDSKTVQMKSATTENSGTLEVQVFDADGNKVQGARVSLQDDSGFFLGVPEQNTLEDGVAAFPDLDASVSYRALASKPPVSGTSAIVQLDAGAVKRVEANLNRATGSLLVSAVDATTGDNVTANVTAYTKKGNQPVGTCSTDSECLLQVPADTQIYLQAAADGYADKQTESMTVEAGGLLSEEVSMLPAALQNDLRVDFEGVRLANSAEQAYSKNLSSLGRGNFYVARFSVNLPAGTDKSGFFVRVEGKGLEASQDVANLRYLDAPASAAIQSATTYTPGSDCAKDTTTDSVGGSQPLKWVNAEFSKGETGSKAFTVKFFVSANATAQDTLSLFYRAYAEKGGLFVRAPSDAELGTEEKTAAKDSCYADANQKRFSINTDQFLCGATSCLSLQFASSDSAPRSPQFSGTVGQTFNLYFSVRALQAFDGASLHLKADPELALNNYQVFSGTLPPATGTGSGGHELTIALSRLEEGDTADGHVQVQGRLPTPNAQITLSFGDANGDVQALQRSVAIRGTGILRLKLNPATLPSNADADLTALVTNDADGSPVTDATLSIDEEDGSPFAGSPPSSLLGDDTSGLGENGLYKFRKLHAFGPGTFNVRAERDGFQSVSQLVIVQVGKLFDLSSDSLYLGCSGASVDLENQLNAELPVLATSSCAKLADDSDVLQNSDTSWLVRMSKLNTKTLQILPVRKGPSCNFGFSATTPSGTAGQATVSLQVSCNSLPSYCATSKDCPNFASGEICNIDNSTCYTAPPTPCTTNAACALKLNNPAAICDPSTQQCRIPTCAELSCQSKQYCDPTTVKCLPSPACGGPGQPCCNGTNACAGYLSCDRSLTKPACKAVVCQGQACGGDDSICCSRVSDRQTACAAGPDECLLGTIVSCGACDPATQQCVVKDGQAQCLPILAQLCGHAGEACCRQGNACTTGFQCDASSNTCLPPANCGTEGNSCCVYPGAPYSCQSGLSCSTANVPSPGMCVQGPPSSCTRAKDCGTDENQWKCEANTCIPRTCADVPKCPLGQVCSDTSVKCVTYECATDQQCNDQFQATNLLCNTATHQCLPRSCPNGQDSECQLLGWTCDKTSLTCLAPACDPDKLISCKDPTQYCSDDKKCLPLIAHDTLPNPVVITLDDNKLYDFTYSLSAISGEIDSCSVKSPEAVSSAQMQNFVTVDCQTTADSGKIIHITADYTGHPFYTQTATTATGYCGDGTCDRTTESYSSCPADCRTGTGYNPNCLWNYASDPSCSLAGTGGLTASPAKKLDFASAPAYEDPAGKQSVLEFASASQSPDFSQVQTGSLYIVVKGKATQRIPVIVRGPSGGAVGGSGMVYITPDGFNPANINIPVGGTVTWLNNDALARSVKFDDDRYSSSSIAPSGTYSHEFDSAGVYSYQDGTRSRYQGTVTVGTGECFYRNPRYFARVFFQNLEQPLLDYAIGEGRNQQIAYSSWYKFYLQVDGQVTTKPGPNLGYPMGAYSTINPATVASTDPVLKSFNAQNPAGSNIIGSSNPTLCDAGPASYKCTIPVSPLVPVNGVAFTIVNDYAIGTGSPSNILIAPNSDAACLRGVWVDRDGVSGVIKAPADAIKDVLNLAPRFSTFLLLLDPKCVGYEVDTATNKASLYFRDKPDGTGKNKDPQKLTQTLVMVTSGQSVQFAMQVAFEIHNDWGNQYALQMVPDSNGIPARLKDFNQEPVYFVDNIYGSKFFANPGTGFATYPTELGPKGQLVRQLLNPGVNAPFDLWIALRNRESKSTVTFKVPDNTIPKEKRIDTEYDVSGNAPLDYESTQENGKPAILCGGNNFCSQAEYEKAVDQVQTDLNAISGKMKIQRLDFNTFGDAAAEAITRAIERTLSAMLTDKTQQALCGLTSDVGAMCQNLLTGNLPSDTCRVGQHCDTGLSAGDVAQIATDELKYGLCDSRILNSLEGLYNSRQYAAAHALIKSSLVARMGLGPHLTNTKPIVDLGQQTVQVLFKRAADGTGAKGYVLKDFQMDSSGLGGGLGGLMTLDQFMQFNREDATATGTKPSASAPQTPALMTPLLPEVHLAGPDRTLPGEYWYQDSQPATDSAGKPLPMLQTSIEPNLATMNKWLLRHEAATDKLALLDEAKKLTIPDGKNVRVFDDVPADPNAIAVESCSFNLVRHDALTIDFASIDSKSQCSQAAQEALKIQLDDSFDVVGPFVAALLEKEGAKKTLYVYAPNVMYQGSVAEANKLFDFSGTAKLALQNILAYYLDERFLPGSFSNDEFNIMESEDQGESRFTYITEGAQQLPTGFLYALPESKPSASTPSSGTQPPSSGVPSKIHQDADKLFGGELPSSGVTWQNGILNAIPDISVWDPKTADLKNNCQNGNDPRMWHDNLKKDPSKPAQFYVLDQYHACISIKLDAVKAKALLDTLRQKASSAGIALPQANPTLKVYAYAFDPGIKPAVAFSAPGFFTLNPQGKAFVSPRSVDSKPRQGRFFLDKKGGKTPTISDAFDSGTGRKLYIVVSDGGASIGRFWYDVDSKGNYQRDDAKGIIKVLSPDDLKKSK